MSVNMADGEARIARSWRLTKISWSLARTDPALRVLAGVQLLATAAGFALMLELGGAFSSAFHTGRLVLASIVLAYPLTFVGVFIGVAICAAADGAMRGHPLGTRGALGVACHRIGAIAMWSLLAAGVGVALERLSSLLPFGERIVAWLVGMAWSVATIFVIPVLALEQRTAPQTLRRSATLVRERWGESLAGSLAIGAWTLLVILPVSLILGVAITFDDTVAGVTLIVACATAFLIVIAAATVTRHAFSVALMHHAASDGVTGPFPLTDLQQPFTRTRADRRRRFGRKHHDER
jgi:Family of unknown function (DUF6159)